MTSPLTTVEGPGSAPLAIVERAVSQQLRRYRGYRRVTWILCALGVLSVGFALLSHTRASIMLALVTGTPAFYFLVNSAAGPRAKDPDLLGVLRDKPKAIVWLFAVARPELFGLVRKRFVVIGRSDGTMLELPTGSIDPGELLQALSDLVPRAEVGYSSERLELYMRRPKSPPRVRQLAAGPQIAGVACVTCGERCVTDADGRACGDCGDVVHPRCLGRHTFEAHRTESARPYR